MAEQSFNKLWITGHRRYDLAFILGSGLAALAVLTITGAVIPALAIGILWFGNFIDLCHVLSTSWRTHLNPGERNRTIFHWAFPLAAFLFITCWVVLQVPYLWSFFGYIVMFHIIRQYYGVVRWYGKLNGRYCALSGYLVYPMLWIPVLLAHSPTIPIGGVFSEQDFFEVTWSGWLPLLYGLYGSVLLIWLAHEGRLLIKGVREWNRMLAIACPTGLYMGCILIHNDWRLAYPALALDHGVQYLAMVALSLQRTRPTDFPTTAVSPLKVLIPGCIGLAILFPFFDTVVLLNDSYVTAVQPWWHAMIYGFVLTPFLTHYFTDAFLWRRNHWEAKQVFNHPNSDVNGTGKNTAESSRIAS